MNDFLLLEIKVRGTLRRKGNSRRIVKPKGQNWRVIKSEKSLNYAEDFAKQITGDMKLELGNKDQHLRMDVIVYYPNFRYDLSVELLKDLLQATGVLKDDRWIREEHLYAFIDKTNPRVKVRLYAISPEKEREIPF